MRFEVEKASNEYIIYEGKNKYVTKNSLDVGRIIANRVDGIELGDLMIPKRR